MRMALFALLPAFACSCASLNESMSLGMGLGAATGGLAAYAGQATTPGVSPTAENVVLGASIGVAAGLITSYFAHQNVEQKRQACMADQTEMHFGDLPPSPFVFPKTLPKKGGRR